MFNKYFVYILASKRNGTLYIGVTNNLENVYEHKTTLLRVLLQNIVSVNLCIMKRQMTSMRLFKRKQLKNGTANGSWCSLRG